MRTALLLFVVSAALATGAAPRPKEACARDENPEPDALKRLSGEWSLASSQDENRATPGSRLLRMVVQEGGRVRFLLGDSQSNSGAFAPAKGVGKLKGIDLKLKGGGVLAGVYAIDGDELTLCFAEQGKPRPTSLEPKGSQWAERWVRAHREGFW
jgi:uncharacterized protein (TIGR03067 family)